MKSFCRRGFVPALAVAAVWSATSCGPRPPRTTDEIFEDELTVDTLYLTEDGREVIAPGSPTGVIVLPRTKDLAWAAMQCDNPDCPGEGKGDRPFVFPWPDPFKTIDEEGNIQMRQPETQEDFALLDQFAEPACPACLPTRNRAKETLDEKIKYKSWVRPYVLPESAEQLKRLEEEKRGLLKEKRRRDGL